MKTRGYQTAVGDKGGFAPNLKSNEEACELIVQAIQSAGYTPRQDIALALDPAATSFFAGDRYRLSKSGSGTRSSAELSSLYQQWIEQYPIVSIEDPFAETDWEGFRMLTASVGERVQIVGDDFYVNNPRFIRCGIAERATNAAPIKPNQIGAVTETLEAVSLCRQAGWAFVISHRSGETEDTFIADFAVAIGGGQIKAGSACRSERIAKYNRLLEIEAELGARAQSSNPFPA